MSLEDVGKILTAAAIYDKRKPSTTYVAAWSQSALRGRWTLDEALDAVHSHYAESTDWLMPGHVTQRIRANRSHPAPIERTALPPGDLPSRERVAEIIAEVEQNLGLAVVGRDVLGRRCPHCAAGPGFRCTNPATGHRLRLGTAHASRTAPPPAGADERAGA